MRVDPQSLGLVEMRDGDLTTLKLTPHYYMRLYQVMERQAASIPVVAVDLQQRWRAQMSKGNVNDWFSRQARVSRQVRSPLYAFSPLIDVLLGEDHAGFGKLMLPSLKGSVLSICPEVSSDAGLTSWDDYLAQAEVCFLRSFCCTTAG